MPPADLDSDAEASVGRLAEAFFAAVSFTAGNQPRYADLHDLFIDGGLLIRAIGDVLEINTVAGFIEPRQRMVDTGELTSFLESEAGHITESFGNVAHRMSTYAKSGTQNGESFTARGLISTQFVRTPDGWRISSMAWDDERPGLVLPERYA